MTALYNPVIDRRTVGNFVKKDGCVMYVPKGYVRLLVVKYQPLVDGKERVAVALGMRVLAVAVRANGFYVRPGVHVDIMRERRV